MYCELELHRLGHQQFMLDDVSSVGACCHDDQQCHYTPFSTSVSSRSSGICTSSVLQASHTHASLIMMLTCSILTVHAAHYCLSRCYTNNSASCTSEQLILLYTSSNQLPLAETSKHLVSCIDSNSVTWLHHLL